MIKPKSVFSLNTTRLRIGRVSTYISVLIGLGCNLSDGGPAPHTEPSQYFDVLRLNHHAINLSTVAPYDTLTLHTERLMGDGTSVPGDVVYSVSSPSISVNNGVLKAESAVAKAILKATMTYGTITRTDSAIVSVIATPPEHIREFGFRLAQGDSAKIAGLNAKPIPFVRLGESGGNLSGLLTTTTSSNTTVAIATLSGDLINVVPKRPGRVILTAATFAYGKVLRDSLIFSVGWPVMSSIPILERNTSDGAVFLDFGFRDLTVGVGGCVTWIHVSTVHYIDMQFEDTTNISGPIAADNGNGCMGGFSPDQLSNGGNIPSFRPFQWKEGDDIETIIRSVYSYYRARVFTVPGVYRYRSVQHGTSGVVRVCDERNDTTCAPTKLGGWF